jgi:hypothetical protein
VAKKKRKRPRRPPGKPATGATATAQQERAEALAEGTDEDLGDESRPSGGDTRTAERRGRKGATAPPVSNRQARKEAARRERERRIKAARRRVRRRRAIRAGIVLAVAAAVGGFVWYQVTADRRLEQAALAAGERLGAGEVQEPPNLGRSHSPPFVEGENGEPATSGAHTDPLPPDPKVYDDPVPEANAVHNLEHGYVLVYYQPEGEDRLPDDVRAALADFVEGEAEVLMAPYPQLNEGSSLALAAWNRLQMIGVPEDAAPDDAVTVTQYFVEQFRNSTAPEAGAV